jgi:cytosine/adenosine deaminase-related metal-dependent hydrolase
VWARLTPELLSDAAAANLAWMALTGCTTTMDHHYVFPRDGGDLLAAEIEAARRIGLRIKGARAPSFPDRACSQHRHQCERDCQSFPDLACSHVFS